MKTFTSWLKDFLVVFLNVCAIFAFVASIEALVNIGINIIIINVMIISLLVIAFSLLYFLSELDFLSDSRPIQVIHRFLSRHSILFDKCWGSKYFPKYFSIVYGSDWEKGDYKMFKAEKTPLGWMINIGRFSISYDNYKNVG